ncbi:MAG: hypothetical protein R3222_10795, partial [Balneolaceae bacterium]|nr:hypothetical protein [Balneolaceae bacterium]
ITKNPFRSIYFACQAMAAEFSTAVTLLSAIQDSGADLKLIVTQVEAEFLKKARERTYFTCRSDENLAATLKEAGKKKELTDKSYAVQLESLGRNSDGETVSVFRVTWAIRR